MSGGDVTARLASIRQRVRVGDCTGVVPAYFSDVPWLLAEIEAAEARTARLRDALRELVAAGRERSNLAHTATQSSERAVRQEATRIIPAFVDALDRAAALSLGDEPGEDASTIHADLWNDTASDGTGQDT